VDGQSDPPPEHDESGQELAQDAPRASPDPDAARPGSGQRFAVGIDVETSFQGVIGGLLINARHNIAGLAALFGGLGPVVGAFLYRQIRSNGGDGGDASD